MLHRLYILQELIIIFDSNVIPLIPCEDGGAMRKEEDSEQHLLCYIKHIHRNSFESQMN